MILSIVFINVMANNCRTTLKKKRQQARFQVSTEFTLPLRIDLEFLIWVFTKQSVSLNTPYYNFFDRNNLNIPINSAMIKL